MLISRILAKIIRHANPPYFCLMYPAYKFHVFVPSLSGVQVSRFLALIIRHSNLPYFAFIIRYANLPYSYLTYPAY